MKFIYVFVLYYPFINHVIDFFHGMVFEIVLNNEIQIFFFSNLFIFLRKKKMFVYIIGKTLTLNFNLVIWTKL
jgi:hypothetical protein